MAWMRPKSLVKSRCIGYRALSGRFFCSCKKLSWKVTIKNLKGRSVLFSFLWPFILLSLPSFPYFLPVYMAWKPPKSLVKSMCIWYRALSGRFFFSLETIFKGDDIKIKRKVVAFFLPLTVYLPFIFDFWTFFGNATVRNGHIWTRYYHFYILNSLTTGPR